MGANKILEVDVDAPAEFLFVRLGLEGMNSPRDADAEYAARSFLRSVWMFSTISVSTVGVDAVILMIIGFVGGLPSRHGVVRSV